MAIPSPAQQIADEIRFQNGAPVQMAHFHIWQD